jgi:hypothetical protein
VRDVVDSEITDVILSELGEQSAHFKRSQLYESDPTVLADLQMAARSSTITYFRDPSEYRDGFDLMFEAHERAALQSYSTACEILSSGDFIAVIVFNGRFAEEQGILKAAETFCVPTFAHEIGRHRTSYRTYRAEETHSLSRMKAELSRVASLVDLDGKLAASGHSFFNQQRLGLHDSSLARNGFVDGQVAGMLPAKFSNRARNIALYVSSQDEYSAVAGWSRQGQADQSNAVFQLSKILTDSGYVVWLRMHPHLKHRPGNTQVEDLLRAAELGANVLLPEDPTSSYSLADACMAVITFGSTFGIEAAYWGSNSILVGRAVYEDLGACHRLSEIREVTSRINHGAIARAQEAALAYGVWSQISGTEPIFTSFPVGRPVRFAGVPLVDRGAGRVARRAMRALGH